MSQLNAIRALLAETKLADEQTIVEALISQEPLSAAERIEIAEAAGALVRSARGKRNARGTLDAFLEEFGLGTEEGVALMCLAEALLRIPDPATADLLIAEKIGDADWARHLGQADSLFVNASTIGLMLTGRVIKLDNTTASDPIGWLSRLVNRMGEPIIRAALKTGMRALGAEFVTGRTIEEALNVAAKAKSPGLTYSFDMLGEGARSDAQAAHHRNAYEAAIDAVGQAAAKAVTDRIPSISVKLSALDPRYIEAQRRRTFARVLPVIKSLALRAKTAGIGLTIDAEEADRLEISLDLIEALARDGDLAGWDGLGLAVQAYQKRAIGVIDWIAELGRETKRCFPVRLVKGAYWDGEIKAAQVKGLKDFPVFTRKASTDLSYLVAARRMLAAQGQIAPQFATHNAHTLAAIMVMARGRQDVEFQRLHGMGALLYEAAATQYARDLPVRVYAPVGGHEDLLPYLVRRLLENGANSSFVAGFLRDDVAVESIIADPIEQLQAAPALRHTGIARPDALYGVTRRNSAGYDITDAGVIAHFNAILSRPLSMTDGRLEIYDPADRSQLVGRITPADLNGVDQALSQAGKAAFAFDSLGGMARADMLEKAADLMEADAGNLFQLLVREAGKTWGDALAEIREAVDFLRYYANDARHHFSQPIHLPGPVGETNQLSLGGRGIFVCISPWNFPLAIFTGQVAAALAAGNAVAAKPADQTPLIAARAVALLHQAGVPKDVLHLLPGSGAEIGAALVSDTRIAGVAFTGSTATAKRINRALAERDGAIVPLIAETGGQNAFVVDSSALLEQVVDDVVASAFLSAGQRCSAARVICVQEDVADALQTLLIGAMETLVAGNPSHLETDIGPIIDEAALGRLRSHIEHLPDGCQVIHQTALGADCAKGVFCPPTLIAIDRLDRLTGEVFGPILHILRFKSADFELVLRQIRDLGFGLTFGLHTRIEARARHAATIMPVGNIYINRSITGAVVGTQPFGGQGLSGTGPKAGGPHYVMRFATERTVTVNTAAQGGNAALLLMEEAP